MRLGNPLLVLASMVFWVAGVLTPAAAQTNDSFAGRLALSGSTATAISNNLRATRESGEPNHAGVSGARSLWWTWTAPATGTVNFSTFGGGTAPSLARTNAAARSLAIYTGDSLSSLIEVASATTLNRTSSAYPQTSGVPAGPSLNVAVTAGTVYQIAVDGAALQDLADDGSVALSINQAPAIYSAAGASGAAGATFAYTILASNNPISYDAADLPAGLSVNPYTGDITGVPQVAGIYPIRLSSTNPGGTGVATLTLNVGDAQAAIASQPTSPVFSSGAGASGTVGAAFSYYLSASGSPTNYGASNLPDGLSFDVSSHQILGTPTTAGVFTVPVIATNSAGSGSATISISIVSGPPRPIITSSLAARATVGTSFYYTISTSDSSGAGKPTRYGASNLPLGLGIDTTTGSMEGAPTAAGVYSVPISATNASGTGNATLTITVAATAASAPQAAPPLLTSSAVASSAVGIAFTYRLAATNAPTSFTADNLPPGLGINAQTGYITGTASNTGVFLVPVTASNAYGACRATLTLTVTASALNNGYGALVFTDGATTTPVIASAAAIKGYVGQAITYQIASASSYSYYGSTVYRASRLPPGLSVNTSSGAISGTPTTAGTYSVPISASIPYTAYYSTGTLTQYAIGSAVVTFVIGTTAPPVSAAPVITSAANAANAVVGSSFSGYTISASNSPTTYTADNLPLGLSLNTTNGKITGTPTVAGNYPVAVSASNNVGVGNATVNFTVAANAAAPAAPVITSSAVDSGTVGSSFSYFISASNSPTGYATGNLPPGLNVNASGYISGTPTTPGVYSVPISATNAAGTCNATLTITIAATTAPVITSYSTARGVVGSSLTYSISASNSPTVYTADNLPPGLSLNGTNGRITGTPTTAGIYQSPISASNSIGSGSATLTFTIAALPDAPVFSDSAAVSGVTGTPFSYSLHASNSPTNFAANNLPPGLSINPSSGLIAGTPTVAGIYQIPISATNASGTSNAVLTITIATTPPTPLAPLITSAAAASGVLGAPFSYTVAASNSPTAFAVGSSLPPGLNFNAATGTISGTPSKAGSYTLPMTASNATGSGQAKLTLMVAALPAAAPVITSPAEAIVYLGESFSYTIAGTNYPSGYAASTLPAGLSFNAATGVISGTPTSVSSSAITLTATNGAGQGNGRLTLLTVSAPGRFTSALSASGVKGTAFTYKATTSISAYSFGASGLPSGLTISSSTGQISGTPTVSGTFHPTLSAYSSSGGNSISGTVTMVIAATTATSQPVLSSSVGAIGMASEPFSYTLSATNSPTSWSVGSLPTGLNFNAVTQIISGTPTYSGSYNVSVAATNAAGTISGTLRIYISNAISRFTSPAGAEATLGAAFSYTATTNVSLYSFYASNLPPGLSYSSTGVISGVPTASGVYSVPLTASTSPGSASAYLSLVVNAAPTAPPLVSSAAAATGAVGASFDYALTAVNLPTGYSAINLPAGLEINPLTGKIFGRPTVSGVSEVPVAATNDNGLGNATLTFVIADIPLPPTLGATSLTATVRVGASTVFSPIQATNTPTSYTATGLPPGLSMDPGSGTISGTPTTEGIYPVAVVVVNAGGSASAVISLTVNRGVAPQFSYTSAAKSGSVGEPFSDDLYASNSPTSYTASGLPLGLYMNAATGEILGVPTTAGNYTVIVTASNAAGSDSEVLTLLITGASAPTLSSLNAAAAGRVGSSFSYSFYSSDAQNWAVSGLPPGLSYSISSGTFGSVQGTPTAAGVYPVIITATNSGGSAQAIAMITIAEASSLAPPIISSAAGASGNAGAAFSYSIAASNSPSSYTANGLPNGLALNAFTGLISGTPTTTGSYVVNVSAANAGGVGNAVITLRIDTAAPAPSAAPTINSPAAAVYPSGVQSFITLLPLGFNYKITADGNPTSFGASNLPPGLIVNPYTGVISGKLLTAGTFTVPISAANTAGVGSATLTIIATGTLPTLAPALTASGAVGSALTYTLSQYGDSIYNYYPYTSIFRDPVTYVAVGLPPGLSLNTDSGSITGTPLQTGSFPVTFSAMSRAGTGSVVVTFVINAIPAPVSVPPILSGNATIQGVVGSPLNYGLSASNAPIGYSTSGLPPGLSINPATGKITGTPAAPGVYSVPITVTNAVGTTNATLTMVIAQAPLAPVIASAAGARATAGSAFNYLISVASSSNTPAPSAYGAENLPAGLSLDASTNLISGTPTQTGNFIIPISATSVGITGRATLTLTVSPASANPAPAAPSAPVFTGLAGTIGFTANPFRHSLGSSGFAPDDLLPAGLSYDAATRTIGGYPLTAGNFDVPLSSVGSGGVGHAVLNLRFAEPTLSLPRIIRQPIGQTALQGRSAALMASVTGMPAPALQWFHDGTPVSGATGMELDFGAAQPADAGIYALGMVNSSGSVMSASVLLRVIQTYAGWQSAYFSPQEIAAGVAADNYDFNGDGVPNLLEYALGRNPHTGIGGGLPAASSAAGAPLQLQFGRDAGKTDLTYVVEASGDLRTWTAIARSQAGGAMSNLGYAGAITENVAGGNIMLVTVQDGQQTSAQNSRFLRLRVTRP